MLTCPHAKVASKRYSLNDAQWALDLYKAQHLIENFFARFKQDRVITPRYDKTARNFLGAIHLAASIV